MTRRAGVEGIRERLMSNLTGQGQSRLVWRVQSLLSGGSPGNRKPESSGVGKVAADSLAELNDRIRRVHSLGEKFAGVRLSQDVSGLRVESLSDRRETLSPRTR